MDQTPTRELKRDFDGTSPFASSTPCCKNVKGELGKFSFHPYLSEASLDGDPTLTEVNPDGGVFERGIRATQWVKMPGRVVIRVKCVCMDDGRELKPVTIEKKVTIKFPMSYKLDAVKGIFAWIQLAGIPGQIDGIINRAAGGNPQAAEQLRAIAGDEVAKAISEMKEKANNLCKNANKCAGD